MHLVSEMQKASAGDDNTAMTVTLCGGDICAAAPDTALEHCTQETGSLFDTLIHGNILRYDG